jgi:hypothetical protein
VATDWATVESWSWFIEQCQREGTPFSLSIECERRELPSQNGWAVFELTGKRTVIVKVG